MIALDGAVAGLAHVVSGPDHLAGVAPLAADGRRRRAAVRVGAQWGLGHGLGVLALGAAGQLTLTLAEVEAASGWAERLVGFVLVGVGALALWRARSVVVHRHVGEPALHAHLEAHGPPQGPPQGPPRGAEAGARHGAAAVGMGLLHGLAGAGHLWGALPSLALRGGDAALYLVSYLVASVAAMVGFGLALGGLVERFGPRAVPRLLTAAGAASIVVGLYWTWSAWAA